VFVTEPKPSLKKRDSSFSWFSLLPLFLLPQVDTVFYLKKKIDTVLQGSQKLKHAAATTPQTGV
jgi:hypothetical protein